MLDQRDHMQVVPPAPTHPTPTPSSHEIGHIQEIESTYAYHVEQARVALSQAQEHLATLLAEHPASDTPMPDPNTVAFLAALLADADFQLGLKSAEETFLELYRRDD